MDTKKNKFLSNKGFVLFSILALIVVLVAIFAPVLSGGVDPTAGKISDLKSPAEETTGKSPSFTQKIRISIKPSQKFGMDTPKKVTMRTK